ncbi:TrmH family RNA methyltransferase [Psychroflexus sp. ALD_RP9]|uniref:TrmH family RNA methyltransferase n=1 Tax=Psychroflexus sp. ALD_RP9 TaxID=2777186 RepID=UPI001A8C030E|nr:TrmH family RNA methyltransferase [Psychroflexus sp. ALD_RP9]QSS97316.1 TrmH family RNA methyltransferase [Psychroflexus sp. ALD_RP9]
MNQQLEHHQVGHKPTKAKLTLVIPDLSSPANLGSIFRIADAFGVQSVFLTEDVQQLMQSNRFKRTSRSTEKYISTKLFNSIENLREQLQDDGNQLIALELTKKSENISTYHFKNQNIALIIGHEKMGLSEDLLKQIETHLHINMYGNNSSLNVAQSLGIALYEISKQSNV